MDRPITGAEGGRAAALVADDGRSTQSHDTLVGPTAAASW